MSGAKHRRSGGGCRAKGRRGYVRNFYMAKPCRQDGRQYRRAA